MVSERPTVMTRSFAYQALPMRVTFGAGTLRRLPDEVAALGLNRVLVLCSPGQGATGKLVANALGQRAAGLLAEARMHVPIEVANDARMRAVSLDADGCVAVGGGSAIGLGKAIALQHDLPVIAVPTTYAGSEMTPVWGLTEDGTKRTGRDPAVLPASVLYDAELTLTLPALISVCSGMNAIAHAVEGLTPQTLRPSSRLWQRKASTRWPRRCRAWSRTAMISMPAPRPSTAPGCAGRSWAAPQCRCTTSSATLSAAR